MQRMLGLGSYRSAWHMMHRIRYALKQEPFKTKLQGIVEVDDTWIGGKKRFGPVHDKKGRSVRAGRDARENKAAVVAFLQRDGGVRSFHVDRVTGDNVRPILNEMVERGTHVMTDSANTMKVSKRGWKHSTVNHQKSEYVRREGDLVVTTNAVEGFFGNLKRGLNGVYHHVSRQHLPLYLAEFDFRYSERDSTDGDRMNEGVRKIEGKRLMLASPKKKE
jgi:transposase-like protein